MFESECHSLPGSSLDIFPSAFDTPNSKDMISGQGDRSSPDGLPVGSLAENPSTYSLSPSFYDTASNSLGAEPDHIGFGLQSPSSRDVSMQPLETNADESLSPMLLDASKNDNRSDSNENHNYETGETSGNNDDFFGLDSALPSPVSPFNPNLNFSNSSLNSTPSTSGDMAFDFDYLRRDQWNNSPVNSVFSNSSASESVGAFSDMEFDIDDNMSLEAWGTPVSCRSETDLSLPPAPRATAMSLPLSPLSPCLTDPSSSPTGLVGLHSKASASSSTLPNLTAPFGGPDDEVYQHDQQHDSAVPGLSFSGLNQNASSLLSPTTPTSTPFQERPSSATETVPPVDSGAPYTSGPVNKDWSPHLKINTAAAKNLGNERSACLDNNSPPMASPMIAHLFRKFTHERSISMNSKNPSSPLPSPSTSAQPRSCSSPVTSASQQPTSSAPTSATAAAGASRARTVPRSLTKNVGRVSKRGQKKNVQLSISPRSFSSSSNLCDLALGNGLGTPQTPLTVATATTPGAHPHLPPSHGHVHGHAHRPKFACIFSPYGCDQLFKCKNEWKRHINTQHLEMEKYLCHIGICRKNLARLRNDENVHFFNRKDLFMSHLRRHHDPAKPDSYSGPLVFDVNSQISIAAAHESFEKEMQLTCEACYVSTRNPPSALLGCTYCDATFNNWSRRLEHVGRHIEKGHVPIRIEDMRLRNWAVLEGILAPASNSFAGNTGGGGNNSNNNNMLFDAAVDPEMHNYPHLQHPQPAMKKLMTPWVIQTKKTRAITNNNISTTGR